MKLLARKTPPSLPSPTAPGALRLGFVPLTDCAPIVMAQELGLFRHFGLRVTLSRELGWATIRDKIIYGELDAAHAVVGLPAAATLGLGCAPCPCLTALVLSLHGNAITLAQSLWRDGVRDGASLRRLTRALPPRSLVFGIVSHYSSHHFLLRGWLESSGLDPARDVRIVVVPPPQMVANLRAGHLHGFCVGEPWNSVAVQAGAGWCVACTAELDPGHPEKVLMVRQEFAEGRGEEHLALVAALLASCRYCQAPENREHIIASLAQPRFVGAPAAALRPAIDGGFDFGQGRVRTVPEFSIFHRDNANEPGADKAAWLMQHLIRWGSDKNRPEFSATLGRQLFRADLFHQASGIQPRPTPQELPSHALL